MSLTVKYRQRWLSSWFENPLKVKQEYLQSRTSTCVSLSSPSSDISSNFIHLIIFLISIEILVLTSWIPASKNFSLINHIVVAQCKLVSRNIFSSDSKVPIVDELDEFINSSAERAKQPKAALRAKQRN